TGALDRSRQGARVEADEQLTSDVDDGNGRATATSFAQLVLHFGLCGAALFDVFLDDVYAQLLEQRFGVVARLAPRRAVNHSTDLAVARDGFVSGCRGFGSGGRFRGQLLHTNLALVGTEF